MRSTTLLVFLCAAAAHAADAPPPPQTEPKPTAWACTKDTLLADQACTLEGKTQPQAQSKEQAKENQRQAQIVGDDLCATLARGEEGEQVLERLCKARVATAAKKCGGDGTRRLLDDAGRFNPGHAGCYAALAEIARASVSLRDNAGGCCACVARSCNVDAGQCIERSATGKPLGAPAVCMEETCAEDCAALLLVQPRSTTATKAPARKK